jgi:putative ABC transport system permease protein
VLLAVLGGVVGMALAFGAVKLVMRFSGAKLPRLDFVPFDLRVCTVGLAVMILTGVAAGLLPALRLARSDVASLLNESGRSIRGSRRTRALLAVFVVAEIAVAVALVAGAGRLVRSFENINRVDPGFRVGRQPDRSLAAGCHGTAARGRSRSRRDDVVVAAAARMGRDRLRGSPQPAWHPDRPAPARPRPLRDAGFLFGDGNQAARRPDVHGL